MPHCLRVLTLTVAVLVIFTGFSHAQDEKQSGSKITGFLAAYGGIFSVSFPQVEYGGEQYGFEDIYGSKSGVSYEGEAVF